MRRLQVLLLAALACALVAVPAAQAARVKTKAVAQDKAAVQKYWTAERMREAIPADMTLQGKPAGKPKKNARAAAQQIPPPYTSAPTRTNGKVFFSDGGSNYVCSGTALLSGNKSTVWTAGHCVHDGASNFHTNWTFVPAYADGSRPYGTWTARTLLTTGGWANNGDFSYDTGAAVVSTNGGSANPPTMGIDCDMTGGSSGGGWIAGGSVVSVNSYGYTTLPNVMFGPYQGSVAQSLYTQAASS